jgi:hypothetical protein
VFHFTPTWCSWLNAIEGFFAKLTRRRLKRGVFPSLVALQEAINLFIEHHNQAPRPFTWKADPKAIIAAAKRAGDRMAALVCSRWGTHAQPARDGARRARGR